MNPLISSRYVFSHAIIIWPSKPLSRRITCTKNNLLKITGAYNLAQKSLGRRKAKHNIACWDCFFRTDLISGYGFCLLQHRFWALRILFVWTVMWRFFFFAGVVLLMQPAIFHPLRFFFLHSLFNIFICFFFFSYFLFFFCFYITTNFFISHFFSNGVSTSVYTQTR